MTPDVPDSDDAPARRSFPGGWAVVAAVAAVVALGLVLWLVAGPGDKGSSAVPMAGSSDAGFARDMAVHHQQAVEMSFIVRDGTDGTDGEDTRRLAYGIAQTQANQRGMLMGWLDLWGLPKTSADGYMSWMEEGHGSHTGGEMKDGSLMPGMAINTELDQLRKAQGKGAEILCLQLLTDRHMGGVTMARACAQQCEVPQEHQLAQAFDAQQSEMKLMADLLRERGSALR